MSANDARLSHLAEALDNAIREARIASQMSLECSSKRMRIEKEIEELTREGGTK